jgi:hypothetical protein
MARKTETFALLGIKRRAEQHKLIHTTNSGVKGVMTVRTLSYIVSIRMIWIRHHA